MSRRLAKVEDLITCPACGQKGRAGSLSVKGVPLKVEVCEMCIGTVERVAMFVGGLKNLLSKK